MADQCPQQLQQPLDLDAVIQRVLSRPAVIGIRFLAREAGAPFSVCVLRTSGPGWWHGASPATALLLADDALRPKVAVREGICGEEPFP